MILLDTQVVLWLMSDTGKLSERSAEAIRAGRAQTRGISIASSTLMEIATTLKKGKIQLRGTLTDYLVAVERTFHVIPIDALVAARAVQFSSAYPKDPADRIIGATAITYGLRLVTADREIRRSGEVECVW